MENIPHNNSCKIYFLVDNARVYFNADIDSGNVQKVQQIEPYVFKIFPGFDKIRNGSTMTFFHFKVYGLKMCKANFIITRMKLIERLIKGGNQKDENIPPYFPVFRRPNQDFKKVELEVKKQYNSLDQAEVSFSFQFDKDQFIQFAFSYPYSYQDCQKLIEDFQGKFIEHESIYFHNQVLCHTQEKRKVHLLTITQKQNCQKNKQQKIQDLFPEGKDRCLNVNKPVILMSARVHPGQSPASFAIEGVLKFLLNENDCRSYLLRKNFLIKIVPMLNPDGVFHGMFRSDINGQNLNRIYLECDKNLHPTIWSFRKYSEWLSITKNVLFFFDFHAHPSTKNFFIYGNSYNEISLQAEVQLFGKLIQANCPYFQNLQSIYSEKQMKAKHKNDNYSKQGCARVFMHKIFDILHSYTVECGYFGWTKLNLNQQKQKNGNLKLQNLIQDDQFQIIPQRSYNPQCYMLMGKSILITILDLFGLNPFPKKLKGQSGSHLEIRKSLGTRIYHEIDTYKMMDVNSYKKLSDLSSFIEQSYYLSKLKGTKLKLSTNQTNNLLVEQITYFNASPKTKQKIKQLKNTKSKSLSKPKLNKIESLSQNQEIKSLSKLSNSSSAQNIISKESTNIIVKTKLPALVQNESVNSSYVSPQQNLNISTKTKNIRFLYNNLQRFNEEDLQKQIFTPYYSSSKKIRTENQNPSPKDLLQKLHTKKGHLRLPSFQQYHKSLQQKSFLPSTRQSKISSIIERSLIEKSLTLRKGSVSKIVYLKKDDVKLLRIKNLIQKKIQRQAIHGPHKKNPSNKCLNINLKNVLPLVNGVKKG